MEKSPKKAIILLVLLLVLALAAIFGAGYLFRLFIAIGEAQKHGIAAFRLPEIQQVGLLSIFTADRAAHPDAFKFSCIIMGSVFFFVFFQNLLFLHADFCCQLVKREYSKIPCLKQRIQTTVCLYR